MARAWWASMRRRWRGSATGPDGSGPPAPPAPAGAALRAPLSTVDAQAPFFTSQAADPFDPTPMLIHADWLEERGDLAGAEVLRGLVAAGMPSMIALALAVGSASPMGIFSGLDMHDLVETTWIGEGDGWGGSLGPGYGDGHREWFSAGEGVGDGEPDGVGVGSGESFEADGGGDGQGELPDDGEAPG